MSCFDNFEPITGEVPNSRFRELYLIVMDARDLLTGLSGKDVRAIERNLDRLIFEERTEWSNLLLDEHVEMVIKESSWELSHLPVGNAPTPENVRNLLKNWPDEVEEPDYLDGDDFSDLDVLKRIVFFGGAGSLNSKQSYPVHCAAVLALMGVADCLWKMECPEKDLEAHEDGPVAVRLVLAANDLIDAALALGYALELVAVAETKEEAASDIAKNIAKRQQRFGVERARNAATARHKHFKPAIEFVQSEWVQHREAFKNNKTDFASVYVGRVRNEFLDARGDPLKVTEKTIREVWLSDPRLLANRPGS